MRRIRAIARWDRRERALLLEATARLSVARAMIVALPVHRVTRRLVGDERAVPCPANAETVTQVVDAVQRVAHAMPFRAACLEQALAAAAMLRHRGIRAMLHLGTSRDDGFAAHAWLSVAGTVVIGGPIDRYREIARY